MPSDFHGLIQHSFALQVPPELRPIYTRAGTVDPKRLLDRIFESTNYKLGTAAMDAVHLKNDRSSIELRRLYAELLAGEWLPEPRVVAATA